MQLLKLEIDYFNLHCPATGEAILTEYDVNENAQSFMGYWINEMITEPCVKNKSLQIAWDNFIKEYITKNNDYPNFEEVEHFLVNYPEPNWVIYKITTRGMACGPIWSTVWHVLDMNVTRDYINE